MPRSGTHLGKFAPRSGTDLGNLCFEIEQKPKFIFFEGKESLPKEWCQATKWMKRTRGQKEHVSKNYKEEIYEALYCTKEIETMISNNEKQIKDA